jgi:serine protease Do
LTEETTTMAVRMRDWLKFGSLVAIAFVFGLAFASTLDLPKRGGAAESPAPALVTDQTPARTPVVVSKAVSDLGDAFVSVAEHVKPAVVFIRSQHVARGDSVRLPPGFEDFFPQSRRRPQVEQGSGSGFIVSADGYILTNNHVVAGADKVTVKLYDKREFTAKVVGTDANTDVAVIKIDARDLPTVAFGNSDSTRVGEWALAIGNPLGEAFSFTLTAGIVSAKGRVLQGLQASRYSIQDFIQTDAAINPGNSGGPLVNVRGQVMGINSAIASETGFYSGYGFAIPINLARTVMDQLVKTGHVERAVMGIQIRDATQIDAEAVGLKQITGVLVETYSNDDSPAKKAGIQPGDVIVALDGAPVENTPQLQQRVAFKRPGEAVEVAFLRQGGEKKTVTVRLARAPSDSETEVAAASGKKAKGEAASKEELLGISVEPLSPDERHDARLSAVFTQAGGGLIVSDVSPEGPAYQRLQASEDPGGPDIIIAVNGQPTRTRTQFRDALSKVKSGEIVTLTVMYRSSDNASGWTSRVVRLRAR